MKRLSLRSRLALLSALAVAVAIAGVAAVSWFAVRDRLYSQVEKSISDPHGPFAFGFNKQQGGDDANPPPGGGPGAFLIISDDPCNPTRLPNAPPEAKTLEGDNPVTPRTNLSCILADGKVTTLAGAAKVVITQSDLDVAAGTSPAPQWRNGKTDTGQPLRVETFKDLRSGVTLVKSQPLDGVQQSLNSLAWLLVLVSGLGIGGAATAGLLVSRAALRPVDRLTEAVEHVAQTEDLTVRMPVEGDDEIARLSRSFNAMTAALEASRDEQKRLVDDAGHELRTPLTSLRTTIDLLIRSDESGRALPEGKQAALLTGARTQMRELTVLITDLLELSRPEQARGTGPTQPVEFDEVVARAVERVRPRGMVNGDVSVGVTASLERWPAHGDEAALERAVVNLLDNAVKFSPPGTTVDVVLRHGTLTVRDRGPGIPLEDLPHVFERFWRSPSARAMPGSGLGLAIAARAVREAGGTVSLAAAPDGVGTIARIVLPRGT